LHDVGTGRNLALIFLITNRALFSILKHHLYLSVFQGAGRIAPGYLVFFLHGLAIQLYRERFQVSGFSKLAY
jgi:hypothetical protein